MDLNRRKKVLSVAGKGSSKTVLTSKNWQGKMSDSTSPFLNLFGGLLNRERFRQFKKTDKLQWNSFSILLNSSSWSSFLKVSYISNAFGIFCKIYDISKLKLPQVSTWTFLTQILIGLCVVRYTIWLAIRKYYPPERVLRNR